MCHEIGCDVAVGSLTWVVTSLIYYATLRRAIYNLADPMMAATLAVSFSAALLAVLCATTLVPPEKLLWFSLVLCGYLAGARVAIAFFGRERFRLALLKAVSAIGKHELYALLIVTIVVTIVTAMFAIQAGGQGDARQSFGRAFRPLLTVQNGLYLLSSVALLSPRLSFKAALSWLMFLLVLSIAFSGKAVFLPMFFWVGLRLFSEKRKIRLKTVSLLLGGILLGVSIMGLLAYGASSAGDILSLIAVRLWLSGDVYIYAYQLDALSFIRGHYPVTFLSYVFHPITSLVGVRGYEKPLGSMIASYITRSDVLTGPNPQLPILLDFFFPNEWLLSGAIAFIIGNVVMGIRVIGVRLAEGRSHSLALGGAAMAIFCPAAGFVEMSQVLIAGIGVVAVTVIWSVVELCTRRGAPNVTLESSR